MNDGMYILNCGRYMQGKLYKKNHLKGLLCCRKVIQRQIYKALQFYGHKLTHCSSDLRTLISRWVSVIIFYFAQLYLSSTIDIIPYLSIFLVQTNVASLYCYNDAVISYKDTSLSNIILILPICTNMCHNTIYLKHLIDTVLLYFQYVYHYIQSCSYGFSPPLQINFSFRPIVLDRLLFGTR